MAEEQWGRSKAQEVGLIQKQINSMLGALEIREPVISEATVYMTLNRATTRKVMGKIASACAISLFFKNKKGLDADGFPLVFGFMSFRFWKQTYGLHTDWVKRARKDVIGVSRACQFFCLLARKRSLNDKIFKWAKARSAFRAELLQAVI